MSTASMARQLAWLVPVACSLIPTVAHAQSVLHTFSGDSAFDSFGGSVSDAGDVNGDGVPDFIVGARGDDLNGMESTGSARVLSGADGAILFTFHGDMQNDFLGTSVAGVGDVNGDGRADLIVGTPNDVINGVGGGSARVFSGADGAVLFTLVGSSASDGLGQAVDGAGDVNGDGIPDFVVGSPGPFSRSVKVFSGADGALLYAFVGSPSQDAVGSSAAGIGDVNGDGFADVILGAPGSNVFFGSVSVFSGADGSLLYTAAFNPQLGAEFGISLDGVGDANGDGFADVIVGAPGEMVGGVNGVGTARVLAGPGGALLYMLNGNGFIDRFGTSVAGAGDVNGDGVGDAIVGALTSSTGIGAARVFSGPDGSGLFTMSGFAANSIFGTAVSGAGDVDGDGLADVIVGAPQENVAAGTARVFSAPNRWTDLGNGLPGTHGLPLLTGSGALMAGSELSISLTNALENSSAWLIIGFSAVHLPILGGTLVPSPDRLIGPLPTDASGEIPIQLTLANSPPTGTTLFAQYWIQDPAGPTGFAASNAVSQTAP